MVPTSETGPAVHPGAVGRIQGIGVPELFHDLCISGRTGVLRVRHPGSEAEIWFEDGRIVHASSDDSDEGLGALLLRERRITIDQLGPAGVTHETDSVLGARLLDAGALTRRDLDRVVLARVRSIVASVFQWEEGEYEFRECPASSCPARIEMATSELIVEGVRRSRSSHVMRRGVGSPQTRYRLAADCESRIEAVSLSEAERLVLEALRNGPRAVEVLCLELYLSDFEVYQALWVLRILRAIEVVAPSAGAGTRGAGKLDQQEFVALLVRLCRAGETGVLHVGNGGVDRTFHLKEGRCVFATSTNPDDGLVAHLFRRGVISLKDREEVGRRLLTNKRVGTILLEMGVIDANDIERMVREQLTEILNDTVRWGTGEFWFAPGELPTLEEITLVSSLEDLVAQSVRTVPAWSRVLRGVGGPDAQIELSPGYLDVLDRMTVGGDEWDLVALLARPRTVRDVCRASGLGDFSVCQTLWSLRLLGAVTQATDVRPQPPEAVEEITPPRATVDREPPPEPAYVPPTPPPMLVPFVETIDTIAAAPIDASAAPEAPRVEEPPPAPIAAEPVPLEIVAATSIPEPEPEPEPVPEPEPAPSVASSLPSEEPALSDLATAELAKDPSFELDVPGCTTEPYMAEARPVKPRITEEDRRPFDGDTERRIEWLNACQQTVYRVVRSEVGAGAANFVRFCGEKLPDGFGAVFAHVDLHDDGSWDVGGLRAGLRREQPGELHAGFQRLIEKELEMVQVHLGRERADALRRKIGDLQGAPTS